MPRFILNLNRIEIKLIIALVFSCMFFLLYKTIPAKEFGKDKDEVSTFDLLYYSLLTQMGVYRGAMLDPIGTKVKVITLLQFITGFAIFLL